MDAWLVAGPVLLPLLAAGLSLLLSPLPALQRGLSLSLLVTLVAGAAELLRRADGSGPVVVHVGGHHPPLGITLVGDRLSALVLLVSLVVLLLVLVYAVGQGAAEERPENVPSVFHPTYLVMTAGIALAFLTGDLFTLFVGIEVMLMGSYALIGLGSTRDRVRAATTYVVTSLLGSIMLLSAVAVVYGLTGTLNLADLSVRTAALDPEVKAWLSVLLLAGFAVKAAVVPLHWWLPDSYPDAPAPVTAVFAALLTKVAVYAVVRTQSLLFPRDEPWTLLLVLAAVTLVVGSAAAIAQDNLNRVLSFLLVSHLGWMLLGLGASSAAGTRGTVLYLVHHIIVQATLFLVVGLVERHRGTARLDELGGMVRTAPLVSVLFLLPALGLSGIPPLPGFVAKLGVLLPSVEAGTLTTAVAGVGLLASLLTLVAVVRAWSRAFWGEPAPPREDPDPSDRLELGTPRHAAPMPAATAALAGCGLLVMVAAGPLTDLAGRAAADLHDVTSYQDSVLGSRSGSGS